MYGERKAAKSGIDMYKILIMEKYKKNDVIHFMTNGPQVHLMDMFGHCEFNPDDIKKEEYIGRIKSVVGNGASYVMSTISPMEGFICIADAGDVIAGVDVSGLSKEQRKAYEDRADGYEAPNVYDNDPSDLDEGMSIEEKCKAVAMKAVKALFPEEKVLGAKMDSDSWMSRQWFIDNMDYFLPEVKDKARQEEMKKKRDEFVPLFAKARFKEYHSVTVSVEEAATEEDTKMEKEIHEHFRKVIGETYPEFHEEDFKTIQKNWMVAVDHNFEEVCVMRDIHERGAFFMSLGPEYNDMEHACAWFRNECLK